MLKNEEKSENKEKLKTEIKAENKETLKNEEKSDNEEKYQPSANFSFPYHKIYGKNRCAQHVWFQKWSWLTYSVQKDAVFCYVCKTAYHKNLLKTQCKDQAFISKGFRDWHHSEKFKYHQSSECHCEAVAKVIKTEQSKDISVLLNSEKEKEQKQNRKCLLKMIAVTKFLARQGIAFRRVEEKESNFYQLLKLQCMDDPNLSEWMQRKTLKYTSPENQNELIEIMALKILRNLAEKIRNANFFSIMADETVDISNKEQLVICVRWCNSNFEINEDYLGLHDCDRTTGEYLFLVIKNILTMFNFDMRKLRGQCYDGAASMTGKNSGLKTRMLAEEPRAIFVHCHGHATNLAACDTLKKIQIHKDTLATCNEILKLIKLSPKRESKLKNIKQIDLDTSPGLKSMAPTRWTVKSGSISSILSNYEPLLETFEESFREETNTEMKARINGVRYQMKQFNFLYGLFLSRLILSQVDNLATCLQKKDLSASEGKNLYEITVGTLKKIKSNGFEKLWKETLEKSEELEIDKPELARKRKRPARLIDSDDESITFPDTIEQHYEEIFSKSCQMIIECLDDRFEQKGQQMYSNLQDLLMLAARNEDYDDKLKAILDFYKEDFNEDSLKSQLKTFSTIYPRKEGLVMTDIIQYFKGLGPRVKDLLSEVCKVMELILVLPAANAESERCFSKMKLIKTYLRSTMSQKRLNHFMIFAVYPELVDELNLKEIGEEFVAKRSGRESVFGKAAAFMKD